MHVSLSCALSILNRTRPRWIPYWAFAAPPIIHRQGNYRTVLGLRAVLKGIVMLVVGIELKFTISKFAYSWSLLPFQLRLSFAPSIWACFSFHLDFFYLLSYFCISKYYLAFGIGLSCNSLRGNTLEYNFKAHGNKNIRLSI